MEVAPVVDIAPFFAGADDAKRAVACELAWACEDTGFYLIRGHGVDPGLIDRMAALTRAFFALPEDTKLRCAAVGNAPGYRPLASRVLGASLDAVTPPDIKEGFSMGPPSGPNVWPEQPHGFRETWTTYYAAMEALAAALMRLSALALGMPEGFFEPTIDRHPTHLNANGYPALHGPALPGQFRAGAHTDYGALTILWKDAGAGSLEVRCKDGGWRAITPQPGCFIVNLGDLMARWTNDRWVSTLHRVVISPDPADEAHARLSLPYFFVPNHDATIATIPTCIDRDHPARYEPVTTHDYIMMKVNKHIASRVGA
jgi:isopenicillin N synthase-like dioxygenase